MHNINEWVLWIEEMISRDELFWCLNNFSQQQTMICMDWFCIDFVTFKTHVCNLEQALLLDGLHGTQWQNRHWVHTTLPSQVHKDKEFICCKFNIIAPAFPAVYRVTITCCFNCITKRTSEINNTRYVCYWKVQSTLYSVHVLSLIKVNRQYLQYYRRVDLHPHWRIIVQLLETAQLQILLWSHQMSPTSTKHTVMLVTVGYLEISKNNCPSTLVSFTSSLQWCTTTKFGQEQ